MDEIFIPLIPYSRKFLPGENFHLFRPGASWAKFFSANYFTQWKFYHTEIFTRGCQAVLAVPHDHQSAVYLVFKTSSFLIYSDWGVWRVRLVAPQVCPILRDPYHRSYSLLPSQRPTLLWTACSNLRPRKLRSERSIDLTHCTRAKTVLGYSGPGVACSFENSTHYFLVSAVGEIKFGEIFVPIQSMNIERNFYPAKILCYTVYARCPITASVRKYPTLL